MSKTVRKIYYFSDKKSEKHDCPFLVDETINFLVNSLIKIIVIFN